MKSSLTARLERLEAHRPIAPVPVHRFIQWDGETEATARSRYQQETGLAISPSDRIILRIIVDAPQWGQA